MSKCNTTTIQIQHKINTEYNCQNSIQKLPAQKNTNTMTIQYKYNVLHSSFVPICPYVQMLLSFTIVCPNSQSHHHETRKSYFKLNIKEERTIVARMTLDTMTKMMVTAFGIWQAGWHQKMQHQKFSSPCFGENF